VPPDPVVRRSLSLVMPNLSGQASPPYGTNPSGDVDHDESADPTDHVLPYVVVFVHLEAATPSSQMTASSPARDTTPPLEERLLACTRMLRESIVDMFEKHDAVWLSNYPPDDDEAFNTKHRRHAGGSQAQGAQPDCRFRCFHVNYEQNCCF
jgi:hypothetical protein